MDMPAQTPTSFPLLFFKSPILVKQCKSALFTSQPHTQVSDTTIRDKLEQIHSLIERWVFEVMADTDDNALLLTDVESSVERGGESKRKSNLNSFYRRGAISSTKVPMGAFNFLILFIAVQWALDEHCV